MECRLVRLLVGRECKLARLISSSLEESSSGNNGILVRRSSRNDQVEQLLVSESLCLPNKSGCDESQEGASVNSYSSNTSSSTGM